MAEVKDDYLEQLKREADWAGTYLSGDGSESAGLREAAQAVIDWEQEYRTLNHLGKNPPHPFCAISHRAGRPSHLTPSNAGVRKRFISMRRYRQRRLTTERLSHPWKRLHWRCEEIIAAHDGSCDGPDTFGLAGRAGMSKTKELTHKQLMRWSKQDLVNRLWGEIRTNLELSSQLHAALAHPSSRDTERH